MIIHDYDAETEPVLSLEMFYGKQKKLVEKCLIVFSKAIHDYLLDTYDCSAIGEITACNGITYIYSFHYEGESIAFYLSGIGSALASGTCYEAYWRTGATKFVMFGSCGSLDREKTYGKYIIPSESYRGMDAHIIMPSLPITSGSGMRTGLRTFLMKLEFRMSKAGYGRRTP